MTQAPEDYRVQFGEILADHSDGRIARWRALSRRILATGPGEAALVDLRAAVIAYDDVFARHCADPVEMPGGTVTVSGSGKETFKTFNVSTAAALLAAAAGVPVVKGVSRSVSATTGALDILDHLGIEVTTSPGSILPLLDRFTIAFVDYRAFCPRFFARYDGAFAELQPTSFFMPAAALAVLADGFVHGLASPKTDASLRAIIDARPAARRGAVVCTEIAPGQVIDEYAGWGEAWRSDLVGGTVTSLHEVRPAADAAWMAEVAHRPTHGANAELVADMLAGRTQPAVTNLVYDNAALLIEMSTGLAYADARHVAIEHHRRGDGFRLLRRLRVMADRSVYA